MQERERERTRRAEEESSPERRRRSAGGQDDGGDGGDNDDQVEGGGRVPRNDREELQRRMNALKNWEQDPNSSVLLDPAAVGVVRAPTARVDEIAGRTVEGVTTAAQVSSSWMPSDESQPGGFERAH